MSFFPCIFISWRLITYNIVVVFVIHWHESAMDLCAFPIPIPPPTSLSTRCHWCLNGPSYKMISCPRPDYPDLVGLLHALYSSCLLYVFQKGVESFILPLPHFSRTLLSFYLLAFNCGSIPSNHSPFFYALTITKDRKCFAFVFHLPFFAFSQTEMQTSEVHCIKHSKCPTL